MIGSWRWNAIAAAAFAALIFLLSVGNNPLATAGIRTGIAFAVTFAVAYAVRWLLGQALAGGVAAKASPSDAADAAGKGRTIDMITPEDGAERADEDDDAALSFTPLSPPKLAKTDLPIDPELLAKALRHMSDE